MSSNGFGIGSVVSIRYAFETEQRPIKLVSGGGNSTIGAYSGTLRSACILSAWRIPPIH